MKRRILAALLLVLAACPVWAQLATVIADDGTERIALTKNEPDEFHQRTYVKTLLRDPNSRIAPLMGTAPCATLGSQSLAQARSPQRDLETLAARYNVVNLWLGNICHGKSDAVLDPAEARAWLLNMQSVNFEGDLLPFLDTHTMLAQLYLFGAPGSAPDYPAALALLNEELKAKASFPVLWFFYIYENGLGVAKDPVQAHVWLQLAADSDAPAAKMLLAQARELNDDKGAFNSYLELSKNVQPPVWFRLGLMYLEGRGTQKDPCKAQEMFQKAASHNWSPVPQAKKYLDQIRTQNLCPQTVLKQPLSNTAKATAPPQDFAKNLSLQKSSQALQTGDQIPPLVVPLATSENGDPISKLFPPVTGVGIGAGIGSGTVSAVTVTPQVPAGVSRPIITYLRDPLYPKSALNAKDRKIQGLEKAEITIDVEGNVTDVSVLESLGPEFDQQTVAAAKQWKFLPATKDGRTVASKELIIINFRPGMPPHVDGARFPGVSVVIAPVEHSSPGSESMSSSEFRSRYYWYVDYVRTKVAFGWYVPAKNKAAVRPVQIGLQIQPDGSFSNVRIVQSSGVPALDLSAMRVFQRINYLGPPPTHGSVNVEVTFDSRSKE